MLKFALILFLTLGFAVRAQAAASRCEQAFSVALTPVQKLNQKLDKTGRFEFFKFGGWSDKRYAIRGMPISVSLQASPLEGGKTYVVVKRGEKLYIGQGYVNERGRTKRTHPLLSEDAYLFELDRGIDLPYSNAADGSIRILKDGSLEVSGYHNGGPSEDHALALAAFFKAALPSSMILHTPRRLREGGFREFER